MNAIQTLLTDHLAIWTDADTEKKTGRGRSAGNATSVYGIRKLRELILELAVRGKLVPQDANDEPASVLLRRIQTEKAKLIAEGKIKKDKPLPVITDEEKPFELPHGWEFSRFGSLALSIKSGGTPSKHKSIYWDGDIPWASVKDLKFGEPLLSTQDKISEAGLLAGSTLAEAGSILICTRMGLGKIGEAIIDVAINQDLKAVILPSLMDKQYFINFYKTLSIAGSGMTVAGIKQDELLGFVVPLPPLAEQHRIVAKVDELMALCDQLETRHNNAAEAHEKLVSHLLGTLTQSQPAEDFSANWQRIAAYFDTLFSTEASIDALKQALLQLAVMGKLVPQDPNDEPASALLNRIQAEKVRLIAEGKIKKDKPLAVVADDEKPFNLPQRWEWTTLATISLVNPRNNAEDNFPASFVPMTMIGTEFNSLHSQETRLWAEIKQGFTHFAEGDIGVAKITPCFENSKACVFSGLQSGIGAGTTELHIVRPLNATLEPRFVLAYLKSPQFLLVGETRMTGTAGQKRLPKEFVESNPFPLPPLAEQHRIVAKVDQLMALAEQLKAKLSEAKAKSVALLNAVIHESLNPTAKIINLVRYRAAIGCYAIRKMIDKPYFGRTAAMKIFYLAEAHVGMKLGFQPEREAAGPLDQWIYRFEDEGKRQGWFKAVENMANGKMKVEYQPGNALAEQATHVERLFAPELRKEFDRLLALLADRKTEEVEIIATLFAAWNDFLIDGHTPSDDEIVTEVREHWHKQKERFTPTQLRQWLSWLRQNNLVPQGRLPHTVHQQQLLLNNPG